MEVWVAILDVLKSAVWPIALGVFIFVFRNEIRALFLRVKRFSVTGAEFNEAAEQQQNVKIGNSGAQNYEIKQDQNININPAIAHVIELIKRDLSEIPENQQNEKLIYALSRSQLFLSYERAYRLIVGSQIEGLRRLNVRIDVTMEDARKYYDEVSQAYPDIYTNFSFDIWLNFLKSQSFITVNNEKIRITEIGRGFLNYLTEQRIDDRKPG